MPCRQESHRRGLSLGLTIALAGAVAMMPATAPAGEDDSWRTRKYGTGGWDGLRQRWQENGVVPSGFYIFDILRNPTGGLDQETAYAGFAQLDLSLNLGRLLGFKGLGFDVAVSWSSGTNLSESIGNVFQVGVAYTGQTVQLSRLYLEQTLAGGKFFVKFGRISAGNDFAVLPGGVYYVNAAIDSNPLSIPLNVPGFFVDPVGQWGVRLLVKPSDLCGIKLAAYNADPTVGDEGENGLDWRFNPEDGVLAVAEVSFTPLITAGGDTFRGRYTLGVYHDSSAYEFVDDPFQTREGQDGFYIMGQQEVYHEAGNPTEVEYRPFFGRHIVRTDIPINVPFSRQGLIPWFVVAVSPRDEISPMPLYLAGGILYRGLFKYRDNDRAGVAVYYGSFSSRYRNRRSEVVIEANYGIQATRWCYLTPDVQYVINPGGTDIPNAFVFGFEAGIMF